ncbi:MAG: DUF3375 family protein [Atopobiaceae bacterium]|nr:DUF3375 family protein [Atopobiaceae bacterium]
MSDVVEVFQGLDTAYAKKTLKLLQSRHSQVYLALFRALFPDASQGMVSEELWSRMDECLADLEDAGYGDLLPKEGGRVKRGRAMCHDLIDRYNWVESKRREDGQMEYRLTSDAIEALDTVERLRNTDTVMTGSRMRTILEQIDHTYVRLSPDYNARLRVLQQRVAQAQEELDRYEQSGGKEELSAEDARDEVANLIDLMSGIPHDLRRLEEDIRANAGELIGSFRDDDRPTGEIIGEYIRTGRRLLDETDHGRSFQDSLAVIGDASLAGDVDTKLDAIAEAPALRDATWESARRIQDSWNQVANGIVWVNRENGRSSHAINRSLSRHDVSRDRELTRTLKELEAAAYLWAAQVSPRHESPLAPTAAKLEVSALRAQPYTPSTAAPPPPLQDDESGGVTLSMEELRRVGGPLTREILDAIAASMPLGARKVDLAKSFSALPAEQRRPVELAGLLQLATTLGIDLARCKHATYECVGLDGRTALWSGPHIMLTTAQMDQSRRGLS